MKQRDIRFDLLKALAIALVVLGHVLGAPHLASAEHGRIAAFIVGLNTHATLKKVFN